MQRIVFLFFLLNLLFFGSAVAEHICTVSVSYKWKKKGSEEAIVVDLNSIETVSADETAAKAKLSEMIMAAKARATQTCQNEHENLADCISAKYTSMRAVLDSMRFETRKTLEEAITADCAAQNGSCIDVSSSEPHCEVKVDAGTAATSEGGADKESGKGEKGKKK